MRVILKMAPYRIDLHDETDNVKDRLHGMFERDDAAIDHAGKITHRHAMKVWQGDRLIAHLPPLVGPNLHGG